MVDGDVRGPSTLVVGARAYTIGQRAVGDAQLNGAGDGDAAADGEAVQRQRCRTVKGMGRHAPGQGRSGGIGRLDHDVGARHEDEIEGGVEDEIIDDGHDEPCRARRPHGLGHRRRGVLAVGSADAHLRGARHECRAAVVGIHRRGRPPRRSTPRSRPAGAETRPANASRPRSGSSATRFVSVGRAVQSPRSTTATSAGPSGRPRRATAMLVPLADPNSASSSASSSRRVIRRGIWAAPGRPADGEGRVNSGWSRPSGWNVKQPRGRVTVAGRAGPAGSDRIGQTNTVTVEGSLRAGSSCTARTSGTRRCDGKGVPHRVVARQRPDVEHRPPVGADVAEVLGTAEQGEALDHARRPSGDVAGGPFEGAGHALAPVVGDGVGDEPSRARQGGHRGGQLLHADERGQSDEGGGVGRLDEGVLVHGGGLRLRRRQFLLHHRQQRRQRTSHRLVALAIDGRQEAVQAAVAHRLPFGAGTAERETASRTIASAATMAPSCQEAGWVGTRDGPGDGSPATARRSRSTAEHAGDALEDGDHLGAVHAPAQAAARHRQRVAQHQFGGRHDRVRCVVGQDEQATRHVHGDGAVGIDAQRSPLVAGTIEGGAERQRQRASRWHRLTARSGDGHMHHGGRRRGHQRRRRRPDSGERTGERLDVFGGHDRGRW